MSACDIGQCPQRRTRASAGRTCCRAGSPCRSKTKSSQSKDAGCGLIRCSDSDGADIYVVHDIVLDAIVEALVWELARIRADEVRVAFFRDCRGSSQRPGPGWAPTPNHRQPQSHEGRTSLGHSPHDSAICPQRRADDRAPTTTAGRLTHSDQAMHDVPRRRDPFASSRNPATVVGASDDSMNRRPDAR